MDADQMSSGLMLLTFGGLLLILLVAFGWFLRKRNNRDAAKRAFDVDEGGDRKPEDRPIR